MRAPIAVIAFLLPLLFSFGEDRVPLPSAATRDGKRLASCGEDGVILVKDSSGKEMARFEEGRDGVEALCFSPDGKRLASSGRKGDIRLWSIETGKALTCLLERGDAPASLAFSDDGKTLTATGKDGASRTWNLGSDLDILWDQLAGEHGSAAIQALAAQPEKAVALLKAKLQPASGDEERIQKLILQLDDDSYNVREKASQTLAGLGPLAEPALRKAMEESKSPEVKERARVLVEALETETPLEPGEALRAVRAVQLLGLIGTPEAKALLETLAQGAPGARQTREAKAVLDRLNHPPPIPRRK